jgi:hypothetical protein
VKPISEWTDAELVVWAQGARNARADALAAEVLRLRDQVRIWTEASDRMAGELARQRPVIDAAIALRDCPDNLQCVLDEVQYVLAAFAAYREGEPAATEECGCGSGCEGCVEDGGTWTP